MSELTLNRVAEELKETFGEKIIYLGETTPNVEVFLYKVDDFILDNKYKNEIKGMYVLFKLIQGRSLAFQGFRTRFSLVEYVKRYAHPYFSRIEVDFHNSIIKESSICLGESSSKTILLQLQDKFGDPCSTDSFEELIELFIAFFFSIEVFLKQETGWNPYIHSSELDNFKVLTLNITSLAELLFEKEIIRQYVSPKIRTSFSKKQVNDFLKEHVLPKPIWKKVYTINISDLNADNLQQSFKSSFGHDITIDLEGVFYEEDFFISNTDFLSLHKTINSRFTGYYEKNKIGLYTS